MSFEDYNYSQLNQYILRRTKRKDGTEDSGSDKSEFEKPKKILYRQNKREYDDLDDNYQHDLLPQRVVLLDNDNDEDSQLSSALGNDFESVDLEDVEKEVQEQQEKTAIASKLKTPKPITPSSSDSNPAYFKESEIAIIKEKQEADIFKALV